MKEKMGRAASPLPILSFITSTTVLTVILEICLFSVGGKGSARFPPYREQTLFLVFHVKEVGMGGGRGPFGPSPTQTNFFVMKY